MPTDASTLDASARRGYPAVAAGANARSAAAQIAAMAVMLICALALLGWVVKVPELRSVVRGAVEMKVNTALALLFSGIALRIMLGQYAPGVVKLGQALALTAAGMGAASLSEYLFGWRLGLDEWLLKDTGAAYNAFRGRMSPLSTIALIAGGIALTLMPKPSLRRFTVVGAGVALIIGCVSLLGYLWNAREIVTDGWFPPVALNSSLCFVLIGGGLLLSSPRSDLQRGASSGLANVEFKVLAGFIVAVSLMVVGGGVTYSTSVDFADSVEWVAHTQEVRATLADLYASLAGAELAQRDYLLTADQKRREDYARLNGVIQSRLAAVATLTADNPTQRESVSTLTPVVAKRLQTMAAALAAYDHFGLEAARAVIAMDRHATADGMLDVLAQTERMDQVEVRLLKDRQAVSARRRQITFIALSGTLGLGAALLAWLFSGVRREMRVREELEEQLQQKAEQLEVSNKELESFSYSISHDLRAPLRAIDGFALMVLEDYTDRLDDEARRYLTVIRENSRRMGALIDDLLSFSRLGRQPVAKTAIDMEVLVREVLHEALRDYQKIPPTVQINPLSAAHADRALVRQVWVNLISNALKYCGKSDRPTITVSGSQTATESLYEIKDNGVGFDMAYADKLFGVFQRLHRADEFEGTGVGLAIVDRIISRHGGRVWAEGKLNRGATFSFSLPTGDQLEGA